MLAGKKTETVFRRVGVRGQGGIEYLILIAALIGLGILVAYYWWSFAKTAGESAAPPGATKSASETAIKTSSSAVQTYSSRIS
ncbi:class III signal peptide-containing protein [Methanopyrus sp.]